MRRDTVRLDLPRSLLYVPADRPDHLGKVHGRGADGIILDLEDSVTAERKPIARETATKWLSANANTSLTVWIRITAESPELDVSVVGVPVRTVLVPKAEMESVLRVGELLDKRERELGVPHGSFCIVPLIESARALMSAYELAQVPRVARLAIGRADLAGELGLGIDPDGPEFHGLLLGLVVASAAAGISAPVAPISTEINNPGGLRASTEQMLRLGFRGRTAIHPVQVPIINEVFTPSDTEITEASALVDAFERAKSLGSGVFSDENGRMIDAAVVRTARDVLARARASAIQGR